MDKKTMSGQEFRDWMKAHNMTNLVAREKLCIGKGTIHKYMKLDVVPERVRLTCLGYEYDNREYLSQELFQERAKLAQIKSIIGGT